MSLRFKISFLSFFLLAIGLYTFSPVTFANVVSTLPTPKNIRVYADDRLATIVWDAPPNAVANNIVGYYVTWGKTGSIVSANKQTIYTIAQIQPLDNGVPYTVSVQSVQGGHVNKPNSSEQAGGDTYTVANGNISPAISTTFTPSSANVDAMRSRLTGFFDDFNYPAGTFDELKWNHATTACSTPGEDGQFINSQFHSHNMTRSDCDRDGNVSRPRGTFDITGSTESNPGQIEFYMDGISQPRDVWYIDIIPTDARKNGIPLDVTSHNDLFDADNEDPGRMLRIAEYFDRIEFHYYDASNNPQKLPLDVGPSCNLSWQVGVLAFDTGCDMSKKTLLSPLPEIVYPLGPNPVPNVRRHWVIQFSHQKIKLFIDGVLVGSAATPALFANINQYYLHSTLFSYNTGKQFNTVYPTTSMLHWDNFGFTGPASTTITHNYLDGGTDGTFPLVSRGVPGHLVPSGNRTTYIPIPDQIGTPAKPPRLMFTIQPFGYSTYTWSLTDSVTVNGKKYLFPDPRSNIQYPNITSIAETYVPHSTGIFLSPGDLKTGLNQISFNLGGADVLNVHIEIDYPKNSAPSYTQPKDIFASANLSSIVTPIMRDNDMYWFVEQKMGLENLLPTPISSPQPTVSVKPGDANSDSKVDGIDYTIWLNHFGQSVSGPSNGDFNSSGLVDGQDYVVWLLNFGT